MLQAKNYPPDQIFQASQNAKAAILQYGCASVINATLGECLQEDGTVYSLPTVIEAIKQLPESEFTSYAPISGVPGFTKAIVQAAFGDFFPSYAHCQAIAAPGGSGALRLAIWNFLETGEAAITTDWHWPAYKRICEENQRKLVVFPAFTEQGVFSFSAFQSTVLNLLEKQSHILFLLNMPAHNPTGYSISEQDLSEILVRLEKIAKQNQEKQFTLLLDLSYIDYAGTFDASRSAFRALHPLPKNVTLLVLYSMTKSFMLSGMRLGSLLCLANSEGEAEQFRLAMQYSARGTWGSAIRCVQTAFVNIMASPELQKKVSNEREDLKAMLSSRSSTFLSAARAAGLSCLPYHSGFFISIPCSKPEETAKLLEQEHIFLVPLANGLRFSVCAVPKEQCQKAPSLLQTAISKIKEGDS